MKALILAAGMGIRLKPITDEIPKALTPVKGKPILIKQLEALHANNISNITIVAGYKSEILLERVRALYPHVNFIINQDYDNTNNMYSAYMARDVMSGGSFVMMNGDVYFDDEIIKNILEFPSREAIATDIDFYAEESMKVIEQNNRLIQISKKITKQEALGTSIDVYKFSDEAGKEFFNTCANYIERQHERNLWSEVALNDILPAMNFKACPVGGRWYEIDNHEDLRIAEEMF